MTARIARPYTVLSIGAALATMGLKLGAYAITGSVGLLSDALESTVNLASAIVAFWALSLAATPADPEHPFGHGKAEYFSSGLEGAFILVAAFGIGYSAVERLLSPEPLEQSILGIGLAIAATGINGVVAWMLMRAGKRLNSITLRADAYHLLTDVWTSVGVVLAVALIFLTGWQWLDPLIALGVGVNVLWTGTHLLRETISSLMDQSLPPAQLQEITSCFLPYEDRGVRFHLLQTRQAGSQSFISFHVLVPGDWTVQRGHDLCESIETAIAQLIPGSRVTTHLEPLEDPKSWRHGDDFSPSPSLGQAKPD
ncbi:cation transporter [Synechocystis salina LEGE 06155]|nr:cation transporter [Synechocystis salina LEGE 06155]